MLFRLFALLLVPSALFLSPHTRADWVRLDRLEASVNSKIILESDVESLRRTWGLRKQLDPMSTHQNDALSSWKSAVDLLIQDKLILQAFPSTNDEIEQEIKQIQSSNKISRKELSQALREQGYAYEEYFELIRLSLAKRTLVDREIRPKVHISDDDIKNYYSNHYAAAEMKNDFWIKMIQVSSSRYKTKAVAKKVAFETLKSIQSNHETFEDAAKRISDAPNASSGGEMGRVSRSELTKPLLSALLKLSPGEVSPVIDASGTFFILKLTEFSRSEDEGFKKQKEEIRNILLSAEFDRQISLWIERQKASSHIHTASKD